MSSADSPLSGLLAAAELAQPDTVELRRAIHRDPELGLDLPRTQQRILAALDGLPLTVTTGRDLTSVVAVLDSGSGPGVLLRADMDALPLTEDTDLPFASTNPGVMHACGHDTHVAMLVTAARLLSERRGRLPGPVVFMFQPGEEGWHGARHMIDEGVLDVAPVERALALHITSRLETGTLQTRGGPLMAAQDELHIVVRGRGGHAASPHQATDPIPVAAAMVGGLQTMITRRMTAHDPTVLTIGRIAAGTTCNIIPEVALLDGTMRTMSADGRARLHREVRRVCEHIAAAHDCVAEVEIINGYPVTHNDPGNTDRVLRVVKELIGADRIELMSAPMMGAEDFAYVGERIPATMAFLGGCPAGSSPEDTPPNHSNRVVFDESAMAVGAATFAAFALSHNG